MNEHIEVSQDDGVLTVRFNRPERKNALTRSMYEAMADTLDRAHEDTSIRVILFVGQEGIFTGGNDLGDFLENPPRNEATPVYRFISGLPRAAVPLIAAVDGPAVGIGTTMLLHCDLVLVTERAQLHLPFVNLALVPEAGSTFLLPRLIGNARAAELLMLGEPFSGRDAVDLGIANRLCDPADLERQASDMARKLAEKPPAALRATKALLQAARPETEAAIRREYQAFSDRLGSAEAKEAFTAFFEKRKPDFSRTG